MERSRFKELREKVARKWAARSISALAAVTREMGARWSSECYETPRLSEKYVAADYPTLYGPCVVDQLATSAEPYMPAVFPRLGIYSDDVTSLSCSRARRELAHRATWIDRRDSLASVIADRNRAGQMALYPSAYDVDEYGPRDWHPVDDSVLMSTRYKRVIGVDDEGARVVTWKPDHSACVTTTDGTALDVLAATESGQSKAKASRLALYELERAADELLRADDVDSHFDAMVTAHYLGVDPPPAPKLLRLDVIDPSTRMLTVAPDAVAFRGVNRYRQPAPVRYHADPERSYALPGDYCATSTDLERDNALGVTTDGITTFGEYRTDVTRRLFERSPIDGAVTTSKVYLPRRIVVRDADGTWHWESRIDEKGSADYKARTLDRPITIDAGLAFVGFRKIRTGAKVRNQRKAAARKSATAIKRGESVGTRGVARTGWQLSDRSLWRAWRDQADAGQQACASLIVAKLTTAPSMVTVQLSDTFAVATDGVQAWRVKPEGEPVSILSAAMSIQQLARRAALAREDVA